MERGVVDFAGTWGQSARLGSCTSTRCPRPCRPVVLDDRQLGRLRASRFSDVVQLAETASTNSLLLERPRAGAAAGLVVVADYQTAGRGRFDRRWESPPGKSLLFSVLLRPSEQELPAPAATSPSPPCPWRWSRGRLPQPGLTSSSSGRTTSSSATSSSPVSWPSRPPMGPWWSAPASTWTGRRRGCRCHAPERGGAPRRQPWRAPGGVPLGAGPSLRPLGPGGRAVPRLLRHRRPPGRGRIWPTTSPRWPGRRPRSTRKAGWW